MNVSDKTLDFVDEYGSHVHTLLTGPPFDSRKPLTCPGCLAKLEALHKELCIKYGWKEWPL